MKDRTIHNLENTLENDAGKSTLLSFLGSADYRSLMVLNKSKYNFFKSFPENVVFYNRLTPSVLTHRLVYHFAFVPNEDKAKAALEKNLDFLKFEFKKIVFPRYTVTNVTLFQLVYGAGDIEMCERVLKPLFLKHYGEEDGIKEMRRQIDELDIVHEPFDFEPIIQAISHELFDNSNPRNKDGRWLLNPKTLEAIEKFRHDFDNNQPKIINKAMQFSWETLAKLDEAREDCRIQPYDNRKLLFDDAIQAWVFRYLMENDKQRFNQGLSDLLKPNPKSFQRLQKNHSGLSFDASLSQDSNHFELNGCCVDFLLGLSRMTGRRLPLAKITLEDFCLEKLSSLENFCPDIQPKKRRRLE